MANGKRTLHEAMKMVLVGQPGHTATTASISEEIARLDLFRRPKDDQHPEDWQIRLRARRYPSLFEMPDDVTVRLLK